MSALTIYIDEAGDPGAKDGLRHLTGRHEWFTLGAVVLRTSREAETVEWIKMLRETANARQAGALHYNQVHSGRREGLCRKFATFPLRGFVFASHKSNLREYYNPRLKQKIDGNRLYNWCFRILLERMTAWAEKWQDRELGYIEPLKIIIAERGHNFDHFLAYIDKLRWQRENGQLYLKGPGLRSEHLDRSMWTIERMNARAGLQLADTVASAFYQGANSASPQFDQAPAIALQPIIVGRSSAANHGVTLWPLPHQASIPPPTQPVFEAYGYRF